MALFMPKNKKQQSNEMDEPQQNFEDQVELDDGGFEEEEAEVKPTPGRGRQAKQGVQETKPPVKKTQVQAPQEESKTEPEVKYIDRPVVVSVEEMFNFISDKLNRMEAEQAAHRQALTQILQTLEGFK